MLYLEVAYGLIAIVLVTYTATLYRRMAQVERRTQEIKGER